MKPRVELLVGLGNPGPKYARTRHNVGFWFLDDLARQHNLAFRSENKFHGELARWDSAQGTCWLLKPMTFMNRSGTAVQAVANFYKIPAENILVVHDELDLSPGRIKVKQDGGIAGHNGLRSTVDCLGGAKNFLRFRVGIGHPGDRHRVADYVLHEPNADDARAIEAILDKARDTIPLLLAGELERVMQTLHSHS